MLIFCCPFLVSASHVASTDNLTSIRQIKVNNVSLPENLTSFSSGDRLLFIEPPYGTSQHIDTGIVPSPGDTDMRGPKVSISNGTEAIEITPLDSQSNRAIIQPINRSKNKGVSTSFYLKDSSEWSFFTNEKRRFTINGAGNVITNGKLLVNNAVPDGSSALRVNGHSRFDSSIFLGGASDTSSFISIHHNMGSSAFDPDDRISPYTSAPKAWANGKNLPVLRIRHPNSVSNKCNINTSLQRDFMIYPYQFGTAIAYNGVVECWVGEWSIHRGLHYRDAEGNGNGWGGVLWVGDDGDEGGLRATARNNLGAAPHLQYGEISVEKFTGKSQGDLRLRLPSTDDGFHFVYGGRGSDNVVAKISNEGVVIPVVQSIATIQNPEKAQIAFDESDNNFKGFDGKKWVSLGDGDRRTGNAVISANGTDRSYQIEHNLNAIPDYYNVTATSSAAAGIGYITATNTHLIVHYNVPPTAGTDNLSFNWEIK